MKTRVVLAGMVLSMAVAAASRAQSPSGWRELRPAGAGFVCEMPGAPTLKTQPIQGTARNGTMHMWTVDGGSTAYIVSCAFYSSAPDAGPAGLDAVRDGSARGGDASVVSERGMRIGSHPGREVVYRHRNGMTSRQRFYIVRNSIYQVIVTSTEGVNTRDADRFLDSLALTRQQ